MQLVRGFASQHTELRRRRGTLRALCIGRFAGCPSQARLETQELKQQLAATIVHHRPPTSNPLQRPLMRTSQHYPATSYSAHACTHARVRAKMRQDLCTHMLRQSAHSRMHPVSRWHQRPAHRQARPCAAAQPGALTAIVAAGAACVQHNGCGAAQDVAQAKRLQEELTEALKKNVRCSTRPVPSEAPAALRPWLTPCTRVRPCACVRVGVDAWRVVEGRGEGGRGGDCSLAHTVGIHRRERCASHYCHCRRCSRAEQRPH